MTAFRLNVEWEYEQRRALRELLGRYLGRLLETSESLNYRFRNLYKEHDRGWLDVSGDYLGENYYFQTTIQRFMAVNSLLHAFEQEALLIDPEIGEQRDLQLLRYVKALHWALSDVDLFDGMSYDPASERDHIFADNWRRICALYPASAAEDEWEDFVKRAESKESTRTIFELFDDLKPNEDRYRWDRFVVFHLLLVGLLNQFGYTHQKTSDISFVVGQIRHPRIARNFLGFRPALQLSSLDGMRPVLKEVRVLIRRSPERRAG